jgi:hypothetical protein
MIPYYDPYISLDPTAPNYVVNLSFNIHWTNCIVIAGCKYSPRPIVELIRIEMGAVKATKTSTYSSASGAVASSLGIPVGASANTFGDVSVDCHRIGRIEYVKFDEKSKWKGKGVHIITYCNLIVCSWVTGRLQAVSS